MSGHNWSRLALEASKALEHDQSIYTKQALADYLDLPRTTLKDALDREEELEDVAEELDRRAEEAKIVSDDGTVPEPEDPEMKREGNSATISSMSPDIKNPDELMEHLGIDTDRWAFVGEPVVKTYQGYRANRQADLKFDEGRISGWVKDDGSLVTTTMYSVRAKLMLKERKPLMPTLRPIQIPNVYTAQPDANADPGRQKVILAFSDTHIGYDKDIQTAALDPIHERKMLSVIVQVARDLQPDAIVNMGDYYDMPRWTKSFTEKPEMYWTTQPALWEGAYWWMQLANVCPVAERVELEGNHDDRLVRYMRKYMIEAEGLRAVGDTYPALSIPHLGGLEDLGVRWIGGYKEDRAVYEATPWLNFIHGNVARSSNGATVRKYLDQQGKSIVAGHIHSDEMQVIRVKSTGQLIMGLTLGCGARLDGRTPGASPDSSWNNSFAVISAPLDKPDLPAVEVINYADGSAMWRGKKYTGSFDVSSLKATFPKERWNW